jgi:hypothetical protein
MRAVAFIFEPEAGMGGFWRIASQLASSAFESGEERVTWHRLQPVGF